MHVSASLTLALALAATANAHIALWHPSLFGFNYPLQSTDEKQSYGTNAMVVPLREDDNHTISSWFGHGALDYPPAPGQFLYLTSGGKNTFELGCNRALTTWRDPNIKRPLPHYACDSVGPLHVNNTFGKDPLPQYFGGTALAIAYTSDVRALRPEDMTVISVNATSPWTREVTYEIPAGLPPCPPMGCLVTWNWIHLALNGEGYGREIYNNIYRAQVNGKTKKRNLVPRGRVPVHCEDDESKCVRGPKQPMYLYQKEGNNMPHPKRAVEQNPSYNMRYGFADGAQKDAVNGASRAVPYSAVVVLVAALVPAST